MSPNKLHQEPIFSIHLFSKGSSFYYQIPQLNPIIFCEVQCLISAKQSKDNLQASFQDLLIDHEFFVANLLVLTNAQ